MEVYGITKKKISTYSMKLQLYPSTDQKNSIEKILHALHIAYNITFHQVFLMNPDICTAPNKDGAVWPDYRKMAKKEWRQFLILQNPAVAAAPATSLMNNNGLFLLDGKRAWQTGMHNTPIDPNRRRDFRFYNTAKPRNSFLVQIKPKRIIPSSDNEKVAWITIPNVGKVKARGFNRKLWFGENGHHTYVEALQAEELPNALSVRISRDNCGDYFASITFSEGKKKDRNLFLETRMAECQEQIGIDVGVKDIAVLSTGEKIPNKHFKREKKQELIRLNRELSRKWGPANMEYRDYNHNIKQENKGLPEELCKPLAQPSKRYIRCKQKKASVERKISRRRNTYYHQQTAALVRKSSMIAVETLLVRNMLRNHKLAYALADAAMSDFLEKIKYKSERYQVPVCCVGAHEPTSQLCSNCGEQNPDIKNLGIRSWVCPKCGEKHDRDINAAKNILKIAVATGGVTDTLIKNAEDDKRQRVKRRKRNPSIVLPDNPDIVVVFSKELTRYNDPRYVISNRKTNVILDDAQGVGYRSISNARNCYKAKIRWSQTSSLVLQKSN